MTQIGGGSVRLNYLGIWSDIDNNIVQITYEDSDVGTVYIVPDNKAIAVTVITLDGEVSTMTNSNFEKLKVGEPID